MHNHTRQFLAFVVAICFSTAAISQGNVLLRDTADSTTITNATVFSRQSVIGYVFKNELTIIHPFDGQQTAWLWALGYDTVVIVLPLNHDTTIWMSRKQVDLELVTVRAFPCTSSLQLGAVKGNLQKRHGKIFSVFGPGLPIHYQRALRISHSDFYFSNCLIQSISLYMPVTPDRQHGIIRFRVYDERADTALPGRDLLHSEILKQVENDGRWYEIDISEKYILVSGNFYVGFETMPSYTGQLPDYGIIVQKGPYQTWMYNAEENVWYQLIGMEEWKRIPNQAAKVLLVCPCRD